MLEGYLVLQNELAAIRDFISRSIKDRPILIIKGNFTIMALYEPVQTDVEHVHLIAQPLKIGACERKIWHQLSVVTA